MTAFATADDLAGLLNREFTPDEKTWIEELLAAASSYLRGEIGQLVFPRTTSTYVAYPNAGREDLPQWPVLAVTTVERDGVEIDFTYRPGYITVRGDEPCEVTFTWGFDEAPTELKRLACVLVSSTLIPLENKLGLSVGGLSSVSIDDFKLAFADAGAAAGMVLPEIQLASIRRQFGRGGVTVVETL